jgi:hypothetical protein
MGSRRTYLSFPSAKTSDEEDGSTSATITIHLRILFPLLVLTNPTPVKPRNNRIGPVRTGASFHIPLCWYKSATVNTALNPVASQGSLQQDQRNFLFLLLINLPLI